MIHTKTDILIFAEDPGAANYLIHLPEALHRKKFTVKVLADGKAQSFFEKFGVSYLSPAGLGSPKEILETFKPSLVLAGTSENTESVGLFLVEEARKRGIPSVGAVDMGMNAAYRFSGKTSDPLFYVPDWLLLPDEWTREEFVGLGFPKDSAIVCGHPHYDFIYEKVSFFSKQEKQKLRNIYFPNAPANRLVAIFATELSDGLNPKQFKKSNDYTLLGRGVSTKRTDVVLEEFLDAISGIASKPYLVLRLHPKNTIEEFSDYIAEFDQISQEESVLGMLYASDCVIGMTSMLLLEAAILGRPTFSIVPRIAELAWLPTIRAGLTVAATNREKLRRALPKFLADVSAGQQKRSEDYFVFDSLPKIVSLIETVYQCR